MEKLSIVIPCYCEKGTIERIVQKVMQADIGSLSKEIIIVDDGSKDGTAEILQKMRLADPSLKILFQPTNQGKGFALRRGFAQTTGELVLVQDADLEYDPEDYKVLIGPLLAGKADVVFGSRFRGRKTRALYFWHYLGNKFLTFLSNKINNLNLTDMETGYKVFRREILQGIHLEANRFGFEPEIVSKVSRMKGIRIDEVPINYHGRTYKEGKKIGWRDGVAAIFFIFRYGLLHR